MDSWELMLTACGKREFGSEVGILRYGRDDKGQNPPYTPVIDENASRRVSFLPFNTIWVCGKGFQKN